MSKQAAVSPHPRSHSPIVLFPYKSVVTLMRRAIQSAQFHLLKALNRWPKDNLRPTVQLQEVLKKRFEGNASSLSEDEKLRQANALYSLLDNRYKKKACHRPLPRQLRVHAKRQHGNPANTFGLVPHHRRTLIAQAQEQPNLLQRPRARNGRRPESILGG
ncbi:hypothetical protein TruAng_004149 [Truncatella angustata]|nr:hypothetical protein TruAng_004149 [Truncatella angustata]